MKRRKKFSFCSASGPEICRKARIQQFKKEREEDLEAYIKNVTNVQVQKTIGDYIGKLQCVPKRLIHEFHRYCFRPKNKKMDKFLINFRSVYGKF